MLFPYDRRMIAMPAQVAYVQPACPRQGPFSGPALAALLKEAPLRRATARDDSIFMSRQIMRLRPDQVPVIGPNVWGLVDGQRITEGCLRARVPVVIVPVGSGGSGGVFRTMVFVGTRSGPRFLRTLDHGSHMRVWVEDGLLVERSMRYNGPDCGHTDGIRRFFVARGRLVALDARSVRVRKDCNNRG